MLEVNKNWLCYSGLKLELSMGVKGFVVARICVKVCVCVWVGVCVTERERERERRVKTK